MYFNKPLLYNNVENQFKERRGKLNVLGKNRGGKNQAIFLSSLN
jgi:hypothetical protein